MHIFKLNPIEEYVFVIDVILMNAIEQGWAKPAPWVKLAPALKNATLEIFT
jgi:hypothetical protein